jgi:hypothetical protein
LASAGTAIRLAQFIIGRGEADRRVNTSQAAACPSPKCPVDERGRHAPLTLANPGGFDVAGVRWIALATGLFAP